MMSFLARFGSGTRTFLVGAAVGLSAFYGFESEVHVQERLLRRYATQIGDIVHGRLAKPLPRHSIISQFRQEDALVQHGETGPWQQFLLEWNSCLLSINAWLQPRLTSAALRGERQAAFATLGDGVRRVGSVYEEFAHQQPPAVSKQTADPAAAQTTPDAE
ncbi:MAG: hypothetical protein MHM6MM_001765 [Cercozoa sp. M6MM]